MAEEPESPRSILAYVASLSPEQIDAEIGRVQRERVRLHQEERFLRLARDLVRVDGLSDSSIRVQVLAVDEEDARLDRHGAARQNAPGESPVTKGSPSRALVRAILAEDPQRLWAAKDVYEELRARGYDAKLPSTRVMLQRLHAAGLADRPEHGSYKALNSVNERSRLESEDDEK